MTTTTAVTDCTVEFTLTERIRLTAKYISNHPDADEIQKQLADEILADEHRTITLSAVQQLSMAARTLPVIDTLPRPDHIHIHNMLHGASILPEVEAAPRRERSLSFERFLAAAKARATRREYDALMNSKPANDTLGVGSFASAAMDTGHGVQILTVMLTGFAICYYAASQWAPQSKLAPVVAGMFGLTFGLGMEITLYLIRDRRKDVVIDRMNKRAQMINADTADQRRIESKHREMEEIAKEMARATQNTSDKESALIDGTGVK